MTMEYKLESFVRQFYFGEADKAESSHDQDIAYKSEWCQRSETRLFQKVIECKPAGINKHFNLARLTHLLSNIYEGEDIDFEMFLSLDDFDVYKKRKDLRDKKDVMVFKPVYQIRPTTEQIVKKLEELYNMEMVNYNEALPDEINHEYEFTYQPVADMSRSAVETLKTPRNKHLRESNF